MPVKRDGFLVQSYLLREVLRRFDAGLSQSRVCQKSVILSEAKNPVLASEGVFICGNETLRFATQNVM
jgi:hypothetical protein